MCGGLGSGAVRVGEVVFCLCTWENVRGGMRIEKGKWRTCPRDRSGFCQRCVCQFVCLFVCFFFFFFPVLSFGTAVVLLTRQAPVEFAMSYFQKVFLEKLSFFFFFFPVFSSGVLKPTC